jgi:hypothetical protein
MTPKNKLVSFRISHDEYIRLRGACASVGARNISELARAAMQRMVDRASDPSLNFDAELGLQGQVLGLRSKLDDVAQDVDRLARAVALK